MRTCGIQGAVSTTTASPVAVPAWKLWTGRVLSALPVLMLLMSGSMKLSHSAAFMEKWTSFGFPATAATPIGIVEVLSAVLYVVPQTRVLGAILVTGYLGGAVCTHVRVGESFAPPLILGILAWAGLFLRDPRLAQFLPLVKDEK